MTNITHCPQCTTQFIVTNEQLSQYNGKVRCGKCLHIFDAVQHLINAAKKEEPAPSPVPSKEVSAPVIKTTTHDKQENYFQKSDSKKQNKSHWYTWLMRLLAAILLIAAVAQSLYLWKASIFSAHPGLKPIFEKNCNTIDCVSDLPKKAELIIIDDSDMQEDGNHAHVINFSTTLVNQANFTQAYPNIELTLTDTEDKPKLRRILKPKDYLPENTKIGTGLAAGGQVKVKLALTSQGEVVAGYRISLSY